MNGTDGRGAAGTPERALWLRSQATEVPEDEVGYFLDLAAFADGWLDDEDAERVAALLAADPQAAGDVAAAKAPSLARADDVTIERVIARARGLVTQPEAGQGRVLLFSRPVLRRNAVRRLAEWSSLAAALAMEDHRRRSVWVWISAMNFCRCAGDSRAWKAIVAAVRSCSKACRSACTCSKTCMTSAGFACGFAISAQASPNSGAI